MPTHQNLQKPTTKQDLQKLEQNLKGDIQRLDKKVQGLDEKVQRIEGEIQRLDQKIDHEIEDLAVMIQNTMASKEDIKQLDVRLKNVEQRLMTVEMTMATKDDLQLLEERMNEKMDRLLAGNDQLIQLLQKMDQELLFTIPRVDRWEEHLGLRPMTCS